MSSRIAPAASSVATGAVTLSNVPSAAGAGVERRRRAPRAVQRSAARGAGRRALGRDLRGHVGGPGAARGIARAAALKHERQRRDRHRAGARGDQAGAVRRARFRRCSGGVIGTGGGGRGRRLALGFGRERQRGFGWRAGPRPRSASASGWPSRPSRRPGACSRRDSGCRPALRARDICARRAGRRRRSPAPIAVSRLSSALGSPVRTSASPSAKARPLRGLALLQRLRRASRSWPRPVRRR